MFYFSISFILGIKVLKIKEKSGKKNQPMAITITIKSYIPKENRKTKKLKKMEKENPFRI